MWYTITYTIKSMTTGELGNPTPIRTRGKATTDDMIGIIRAWAAKHGQLVIALTVEKS